VFIRIAHACAIAEKWQFAKLGNHLIREITVLCVTLILQIQLTIKKIELLLYIERVL
jgi:hypothetical protein